MNLLRNHNTIHLPQQLNIHLKERHFCLSKKISLTSYLVFVWCLFWQLRPGLLPKKVNHKSKSHLLQPHTFSSHTNQVKRVTQHIRECSLSHGKPFEGTDNQFLSAMFLIQLTTWTAVNWWKTEVADEMPRLRFVGNMKFNSYATVLFAPCELKNYIFHSYANQHHLPEKVDQHNRKNCKSSPNGFLLRIFLFNLI